MNSKLRKYAVPKKICYIQNLTSTPLILYISKFLIDSNIKNINKKDLVSFINIFPAHKTKWIDVINCFKEEFYLMKYSEIYCDVKILAHDVGLDVSKKEPLSQIQYAVVPINDINFKCPNNGKLKCEDGCPVISLINENDYKLYTLVNKLKYTKHVGLFIFDNSFTSFRTWDRILIIRGSFDFLNENDILLNIYGSQLQIESRLSMSKFKKLINERERKKVF